MKVSFNWLQELVKIGLGPRELAERLTMAGLEVEGVEEPQVPQVRQEELSSLVSRGSP